MAKTRQSAAQQPNVARNMDSVQRTLVRAYTDSALRDAPQAVTAALPPLAPRGGAGDRAVAQPPLRVRSSAPGSAKGGAHLTAPAARAPVFARPRRVAILPVRDATPTPGHAATVRALEDSLRKALVAMGYTPASDAELLRLLSQGDMSAQRRIADTLGIGAVVMTILSTRADEILAQSIVLDVWRNVPISDRTATDRDKPQEALGLVREVSRALERVSWRSRADPKRVLVFDLENQTGVDSLGRLAQQLSDSLRAAVVKGVDAEVVTDPGARATRDVAERRVVGARLGVGAIVAGGLYRARGDSVTLRLSARDMSEERSFPNVDVRAPRSELVASFRSVVDRLLAELGQVNWGPKVAR